jgi:AraC-like DNA-binding protein
MDAIRNIDIASIAVQVWAVNHHHWSAGQTYHHDPANHLYVALQGQLWLVQEGRVEVRAKGQKWRVQSGEAMFLPVSLERDIITPEQTSWLSLRLWVTVFNKFNLMKNISLPAQWRPDERERALMESWMGQIVQEFRLDAAHQRLTVGGLAQALFGLCWPHLTSTPLVASIHSELPEWLAQTLRRISNDPACNITDLAYEAGFSPAQFRRAFHQHIGSTPRDYLKTQRLEKARHYLDHTDLTLRVIAEQIGWRDANHFSQVFRETYGLSPLYYRMARDDNDE